MDIKDFCDKYYTNRENTACVKWDGQMDRFGEEGLLAMWVADMDFKVPECVIDALQRRVEHGVFGYSLLPNGYFESIIDWEYRHHGYKPKKEYLRLSPGVVPALNWCVQIFTKPKDAIIIMTPIYPPFHNCIKDNGRTLINSELKYDKGVFSIDFEDFEKKIKNHSVKMCIISSPHNPGSRVYREAEIKSILEICDKYGVLLISDEIHKDMVFGDFKHIPTATIENGRYSNNIITATSVSKTFNLAAGWVSTIIIENEEYRKLWDAHMKLTCPLNGNMFGAIAAMAALNGGEEWYDGVKRVIYHNYQLLVDGLKKYDDIYICPLEGTYLAFVDFRGRIEKDKLQDFIQKKCKIAVNYGNWFGEGWGGFARINLATHPDNILETVRRIVENLDSI